MVRILIAMSLFFITSSCYAFTGLSMKVSDNSVEIGKPIRASIIATNINANLSSLKLTPLYKDFGVEVIEISNKSENINRYQELHINLFPKYIGHITLPPLTLLKKSTKEIALNVTPAKTPNGTIAFSSSITSTDVWQRQKILLTTTVITPSKFSKLILDDFQDNRIEIVKLNSRIITLSNGTYQHQAGWVLYPQTHGKYSITAPAINYRVSGTVQRKFFAATLHLNIKELPSYVSPLMPVGTLSIKSDIKTIDSGDYSHAWNVTFSSSDISPTTLASLPLPKGNNINIDFGDAAIALAMNSVSLTTPVSFKGSGLYSLPALNYKTFNPNTGKLDTLRLPSKSVLFITLWFKTILALFSFLILMKLFYSTYKYVHHAVIKNRDKRNIINSSLMATSPQQLHAIINQYIENRGWERNLTLQRLIPVWNSNAKSTSNSTINELSLACYTKSDKRTSQVILNKKVYNLLND